MRISRDNWAMTLAVVTAKRSTCCRRAVGAVLLDASGHVIATGYNGVAAGQPHCNELGVVGVGPGRRYFGQAVTISQLDPNDPKSYPNACDGAFSPSGTNLDGCEAIHAEQNALLQCHDVREIHTIYCTASPCMTCTKLLLNTGCQRVVFVEEYPHPAAKELWEGAGRVWDRLESVQILPVLPPE